MHPANTPTAATYDYRKYAILFVHAETNIRNYFLKLFEQDFDILLASNANEAMEICANQPQRIAIAMADQELKGNHNGAALLMNLSRQLPHIVNILSLKYSDSITIHGIPVDPCIYRFVMNPWDVPQLETTLRRAMEFFLIRQERNDLRDSLQECGCLQTPTQPDACSPTTT